MRVCHDTIAREYKVIILLPFGKLIECQKLVLLGLLLMLRYRRLAVWLLECHYARASDCAYTTVTVDESMWSSDSKGDAVTDSLYLSGKVSYRQRFIYRRRLYHFCRGMWSDRGQEYPVRHAA